MKIHYKNISEQFFKNPEQIKKDLDKKKSDDSASRLVANAKKALLKNALKNIHTEDIEKTIEKAFDESSWNQRQTKGSNTCFWIYQNKMCGSREYSKMTLKTSPMFSVLSTYICDNWFDIRLIRQEDFVTIAEDHVNINLYYTGSVVVDAPASDSGITWRGSDVIYAVPVEPRRMPNPEIYSINDDIVMLRLWLEYNYPGVYFKIKFSILSREGETYPYASRGNEYVLGTTESSWKEVIENYNDSITYKNRKTVKNED